MENNSWYDAFVNILYERFQKKSLLAEELMALLCIEREAIYRRLRKDVPFLAHEMVKIACAWNISLDEIIGTEKEITPFHFQPLNFLEPSKKGMSNMYKRINALDAIETSLDSEYTEASNKLPGPIHLSAKILYQFEIFKWAYHINSGERIMPFDKIIIPEKVCKGFEVYQNKIKNLAVSNYILDPLIFVHLVDNISYFHSILLITENDKNLLKEALLQRIDYMNELANLGYFPDTRKKVNLYLSQLIISNNYCYFYSEHLKSCHIYAFGKYDICSYELEMVETFRRWLNMKKRAAIQISEVNEKDRIEYFTRQKEIVESL